MSPIGGKADAFNRPQQRLFSANRRLFQPPDQAGGKATVHFQVGVVSVAGKALSFLARETKSDQPKSTLGTWKSKAQSARPTISDWTTCSDSVDTK